MSTTHTPSPASRVAAEYDRCEAAFNAARKVFRATDTAAAFDAMHAARVALEAAYGEMIRAAAE